MLSNNGIFNYGFKEVFHPAKAVGSLLKLNEKTKGMPEPCLESLKFRLAENVIYPDMEVSGKQNVNFNTDMCIHNRI
jgi:hypothetical protein